MLYGNEYIASDSSYMHKIPRGLKSRIQGTRFQMTSQRRRIAKILGKTQSYPLRACLWSMSWVLLVVT